MKKLLSFLLFCFVLMFGLLVIGCEEEIDLGETEPLEESEVETPGIADEMIVMLEFDGVDNLLLIDGSYSLSDYTVTLDFISMHEVTSDEVILSIVTENQETRGIQFFVNENNILRVNCREEDGEFLNVGEKPLETGEFYSITLTRQGEDRKVFVNGDLFDDRTGSVDVLTGPIRLGGVRQDLLNAYVKIGNLQIWDRALSNEKINDLLLGELTGTEEGLVGYWPMNEGVGDTVYDQTDNGNHGSISGAEFIELLMGN